MAKTTHKLASINLGNCGILHTISTRSSVLFFSGCFWWCVSAATRFPWSPSHSVAQWKAHLYLFGSPHQSYTCASYDNGTVEINIGTDLHESTKCITRKWYMVSPYEGRRQIQIRMQIPGSTCICASMWLVKACKCHIEYMWHLPVFLQFPFYDGGRILHPYGQWFRHHCFGDWKRLPRDSRFNRSKQNSRRFGSLDHSVQNISVLTGLLIHIRT